MKICNWAMSRIWHLKINNNAKNQFWLMVENICFQWMKTENRTISTLLSKWCELINKSSSGLGGVVVMVRLCSISIFTYAKTTHEIQMFLFCFLVGFVFLLLLLILRLVVVVFVRNFHLLGCCNAELRFVEHNEKRKIGKMERK